jgi:thioredoxin-related protein
MDDRRYTAVTLEAIKEIPVKMLKRLNIYLLLLLSLLTCIPANAAELAFFDPTFGDFSEELEIAKEEGKAGIFVFFEMDECPFCHRMKTSILNQPDVVAFYKKHFKTFQVDIEGDIEMTDFDGTLTTQKDFSFKKHRVRATPVMAFFDLTGNRVVRYTGATSSKEEFLLLGEYALNKHYTNISFTRFKRQQRKAK